MLKFFLASGFLALSTASWSDSRNCIAKDNVQACPNSGATILDETYPTQAFVISTQGYHTGSKTKESEDKLPADFITSIIESYAIDTPDIIVPTTSSEFQSLLKKVEENLIRANKSPEYISQRLSLIKHVENESYTWQQDYFESMISPTTGRPVLREVESYGAFSSKNKNVALIGLSGVSKECPVEIGQPLKNFKGSFGEDHKTKSWGNGEMGGNIEGLPGGLCLSGNNQAQDFVSQYCGTTTQDNAVEVDVGWMTVGHVDEVIKVVPTFPKKLPNECNFTIWVASPDAGIAVLKQPEFINQPFMDLKGLTREEGAQKLNDIVNSKGGAELCRLLSNFNSDADQLKENQPKTQEAKGAQIWKFLKNLLIPKAHAGAGVIVTGVEEENCADKLENITNRQMVELMEQDPDFMLMNKLIQEKMEKNKAVMKEKLSTRLPQCKEISFIDVPDLFYGHGIAEVNGKKELAEPGNGRSLFPNPTNSVLANETMIVPQAPNQAFNSSVKESLVKQGLKTSFVNTWNYAHAGDGNMHCSSHSLTYCKPIGQK